MFSLWMGLFAAFAVFLSNVRGWVSWSLDGPLRG